MVEVRSSLAPAVDDDVRVYLPASAVNDSDAKEFAANDAFERSVATKTTGRLIFDDITCKSDFIRTFEAVKPALDIRPGHTVLELGACHGWASVIVKDDHPAAHVVTSDLVPECVKHCRRYERALGKRVDEKWAFSVRDIPFADAQFDRIFTFASFHHFGDHGDYARSMAEVARVLKPGGKLLLLYEPTSPRYLYRWAFARANRTRAHERIDEDVLVLDHLGRIARSLGLRMDANLFPFYRYRGSVASTMYYFALAKLGLGALLVCTANILFSKP